MLSELIRGEREANAQCTAELHVGAQDYSGTAGAAVSSIGKDGWDQIRRESGHANKERENFKQRQHLLLQIHDDGKTALAVSREHFLASHHPICEEVRKRIRKHNIVDLLVLHPHALVHSKL